MNPKNKQEFDSWATALWLAQKCRQSDKQAEQATDGGDDTAVTQKTLASVLASETTLVNEYATLVGYLKVVARLFYVTFFRKKRDGSVPILRGIFFIQ